MKQSWKKTKEKEYSKAAKSNQFPRFEARDKRLTLPPIGRPMLVLQTGFYLLAFSATTLLYRTARLAESFLQPNRRVSVDFSSHRVPLKFAL